MIFRLNRRSRLPSLHPGENPGMAAPMPPGFQVNDEPGTGGNSGQRLASVSRKGTEAEETLEKGGGASAGPVSPRTREFRSRMAGLEAEHKVNITYNISG